MKFEIHHTKSGDFFIIEGDDIESIRERVKMEASKRRWEDKDCYRCST